MKIYVVTAYRWGQRNAHSYIVGARADLEEAKKLADHEVDYRGGKYGCEVVLVDTEESKENRGDQVYFAESPFYGMAGNPGYFQPADKKKNIDFERDCQKDCKSLRIKVEMQESKISDMERLIRHMQEKRNSPDFEYGGMTTAQKTLYRNIIDE